ncbi:alpha/beta fold hydrolase [Oceanospirillum maris]|uniref:alpha/beta fold hydrolase n=1 Tax=Oceanospirillum maris TaxID=64977 RepID=UPI00040FC0FC|nr:hypothetical protein [Oceanospirillum maris]
MKLVLLPGMDGTGILFKPLLDRLEGVETQVITLPNYGPQDYLSLSRYVADHIGSQECVVLAESFSGGIAEALLSQHDLNIKHVIFVASFLSNPAGVLPYLASVLPLQRSSKIPVIAPWLERKLLLGASASEETLSLFRCALDAVSGQILKKRLRQIFTYTSSSQLFEVDATYIRAKDDVLVGDRAAEFNAAFSRLSVVDIAGPHFILQAQPSACCDAIMHTMGHLIDNDIIDTSF